MHKFELAFGSTNPVAGAVGGGAQPRELLAGGGRPGAQRIHLAGQGCEAFPAVGDGPGRCHQRTLGRGEFRLALLRVSTAACSWVRAASRSWLSAAS